MDSLSQEITIIIVASGFFLLIAVSIIILFLIYQQKQLRLLLEKKELGEQFQKELLKTRLEAQEETLHQLSLELHDNIGQLLSSSKLLIGVADRSLPASLETLQLADGALSKAITELRMMSKSLNKEWLEKFNLFENLSMETSRINASLEYTITLRHPPSIEMETERQIILFRMIQEAFQNSLKHGRASSIDIRIEQVGKNLRITVEDNGKGFDPTDESRHGVGMTNIKNRAQLMGGKAQWQSGENGTLAIIQLPVNA